MATTYELGRGVLYLSKSQLELALVTSIAVSAQPGITGSSQLSDSDIYHLIRTGNTYDSRNPQFGFWLEVNFDGRPLASEEKNRLTARIISAPVQFFGEFA
jgi:hypothetical protein